MTKPIKDERVPTPAELHMLRQNLVEYLDREVPSSDNPVGNIVRDITFFVGVAFGCDKNPDGYKDAETLFRQNFMHDD